MTQKVYREELGKLEELLLKTPKEEQWKVKSKIHALRVYFEAWSANPEVMKKLS